jgi:hypothetical protein
MQVNYTAHWIGEDGTPNMSHGELNADDIREAIERKELPKSIDHVDQLLDDFEITSFEP